MIFSKQEMNKILNVSYPIKRYYYYNALLQQYGNYLTETFRLKLFIGLLLFIVILVFTSCTLENQDSNLLLWYNKPATVWEETIPLGNGRLGAMPDGGIYNENITLNEISLWSGSEENTNNPEAINYLSKIRGLLLDGKNLEAQNLMFDKFKCNGAGSGLGNGANIPYGCYQKLGNLHIKYNYQHKESGDSLSKNYKRTLSLKNAVSTTSFELAGVNYSREYFVSQTNDVIIIKLMADKKNALNFDVTIDREERANVYCQDNKLFMNGQLNNGVDGLGMKYSSQTIVVTNEGEVKYNSNTIHTTNAKVAYIFISATTDFRQPDFEYITDHLLNIASLFSYDKLKQNHIKAYQEKFNRVELNLGKGNSDLPTNERLALFQKKEDPSMAALYFQFGRYLMISGTRDNSLPLNLQGLWVNNIQTPWNGDYHLNINLQMNYWPVEVTNLSELTLPLIKLTQNMVPSGKETAKTFYNAKGWVAHVITNPWKFTAPAEQASWGATNTGGAWLCSNLWEHYAFNNDTAYLHQIYPTLKGAAEFFLSNMIKERKHGWLVTAPSSSPENSFRLPGSNQNIYICMGPTMDVQIVTELFKNTLKAIKILSIDAGFAKQIESALSQMPPMQISKKGGYLQEWLEDYEETDPTHRHVSHLYGLYPSNLITTNKTPELIQACQNTLERRGDEGTGWSRAWKINFWARLKDGNRAYKLFKSLLKPSFEQNIVMTSGGGTYPNLFCAHPPFQIDGNLGGCAGIAEMLIQSHDGYIELLPAIPDSWKDGNFSGLKARGGVIVNAVWINGKIEKVVLKSNCDQIISLKINGKVQSVSLEKEKQKVIKYS
jgi:alpha-L-fucosidase 2